MTQDPLFKNLLDAGLRPEQLHCLQHNPAFAHHIAKAINEAYDRFCGCYQAAHNRYGEALITPLEIECLGLGWFRLNAKYAQTLESVLPKLSDDNLFLIPGPPEALTIEQVIALWWPKNSHDPLDSWVASASIEQKEQVKPGWLIARPEVIANSRWKLREECDRLLLKDEVVPNTTELVWMGLVALSAGREFTRTRVRSSTSLSQGMEAFVTIGKHGPYMYASIDDRRDDTVLLPIRRIPL